MSDPLSDVENKKGQIDMGIMGARVYEGALYESGSRFRAFMVTYAFWAGMFKGSKEENLDDTSS